MVETLTTTCDRQRVAAEVSTKELAAALDVHIRTVQRWYRDGAIRPTWTTPGGHPRWDIDDVRQQLGEQRKR